MRKSLQIKSLKILSSKGYNKVLWQVILLTEFLFAHPSFQLQHKEKLKALLLHIKTVAEPHCTKYCKF